MHRDSDYELEMRILQRTLLAHPKMRSTPKMLLTVVREIHVRGDLEKAGLALREACASFALATGVPDVLERMCEVLSARNTRQSEGEK